ncbi:MAG: heterodisulfide reductase subunit A, partial [Deltaproteobacteria bacterium]|nr:heterodisulfide reductase subunit A [Deltaproteobacteria bacterium]
IIALACPGVDASCFCAALGLAPDATRGADVMLVPVQGGYAVQTLTARGEELVRRHASRFGAAGNGADAEAQRFRDEARRKVQGNLQLAPEGVRGWLERSFEHPFWATLALRCHGCGACASVCPTCHCFDIVDEPEGLEQGTRRRNWDTCQTARFTVHGSGHNPRAQQNARFRQRVNHKFAIYPAKFQEVLCTGCGRCVRACPGGMDLLEVLGEIQRMAQGERGAP